jgi:CheY-like chemotaxis protein
MTGETASRRILIIEDWNDTTDTLALLLRLRGQLVGVARSGLEGLRAALTTRPEVILLDIGLPGMDGYEVARRLRLEGGLEEVRIIVISGYCRDTDRARSEAAGIVHHLAKPASMEELEALLGGGPDAP